MENNPIVTITMADGGKIVAELYPDVAPQSVYNFISLIKKGFYNGLIFHRCIYGFMIQGGCPDGTGMGGPGYCIKGEFKANGFNNDLRHSRGVLSMARAQAPDSAGSQFFIMHKDSPHLDGEYAAFGMVIDGMDVVDAIASAPRNMMTNKPKKPQVMASVTVDTKGVEYPEPETLPDPSGRYTHRILPGCRAYFPVPGGKYSSAKQNASQSLPPTGGKKWRSFFTAACAWGKIPLRLPVHHSEPQAQNDAPSRLQPLCRKIP